MSERLIFEEEIEALIARFGHPRRHTCTIDVTHQTFHTWIRKISTGPVACRGEVVMVVVRPNGNVLLHTKHFYPHGVYRLPSGRVLWQETVEETLHRELKEETNLDVKVERFVGLIEYELKCKDSCIPFVSYVFQVREVGGQLCCLDDREGITDFREASLGDLASVAAQLERLEPRWRDWGNFRAIAHRMVEELLGD
ncbi:MAG: NUDIX domain-containing protein [Anaerolineae bacterium]|nr:NUDIX domain-containing protein [Anaerolineae bacterium]NIN98867.1 NUDIX domain-containing protein [Anaerolineae bacterium]NIQ81778.1 NUDIX domain-containing protein [Anaerolineae bacterium]